MIIRYIEVTTEISDVILTKRENIAQLPYIEGKMCWQEIILSNFTSEGIEERLIPSR